MPLAIIPLSDFLKIICQSIFRILIFGACIIYRNWLFREITRAPAAFSGSLLSCCFDAPGKHYLRSQLFRIFSFKLLIRMCAAVASQLIIAAFRCSRTSRDRLFDFDVFINRLLKNFCFGLKMRSVDLYIRHPDPGRGDTPDQNFLYLRLEFNLWGIFLCSPGSIYSKWA